MTIRLELAPEQVRHFPRLSRFYGLGFRELCGMHRWAISLYLDALPGLAAEEQLLALQAADYPYVSNEDRKRTHRELVRIAREDRIAPAKAKPQAAPLDVGALASLGFAVRKD